MLVGSISAARSAAFSSAKNSAANVNFNGKVKLGEEVFDAKEFPKSGHDYRPQGGYQNTYNHYIRINGEFYPIDNMYYQIRTGGVLTRTQWDWADEDSDSTVSDVYIKCPNGSVYQIVERDEPNTRIVNDTIAKASEDGTDTVYEIPVLGKIDDTRDWKFEPNPYV